MEADAGLRERVLGLDMLRSLAIVLVLVSHFANSVSIWYGLAPPRTVILLGDLGVELFFALSGFLIGRILLDIVRQAPTLRSLRTFLVRRWMRTLPAYLAWLLVLAVLFPPPAHLGWYLLRFATMTQNLARPMPADYWFAVAWSLSVEEWFYLLFGSAAIIAVIALRRRWAIWLPLAAMLLGPFVLRLCVPAYLDFATGFSKMVPFRLDEIGYGVVLAWFSTRRAAMFAHPVLPMLIGLFLVAAGLWWILPLPSRLMVIAREQLAAIGFALCIPAALRIRSAPRWLARTSLHVSRLSYCLYLVHLTLLVDVAQDLWLRHRVSATGALAIAALGSLAAAELLSRCVERPFMQWRPRQFLPVPAAPGGAFGVAG